VRFDGKSNTVHTRSSLIFPTGAINMPFDTPPRKGSDTVVLHTPGLYVFTCNIHPLSSNSKCNTAGPEGLRCCHDNKMLHTLEC
jgi:hypothetical protein